MELRRYLIVLRRRLLLIIVCVVVGLGVGYTTRPTGTTYQAGTIIYVGFRQFGEPGDLSNDRTVGVQQIARTFALMIPTEPIATAAVASTRAPRAPFAVAANTRTAILSETNLISVVYSDPDPLVAQLLANGMSDAFVNRVQEFEPGTTGAEGELPSLPAYVYSRARLPTVPITPSGTSRLVLGGLFGFVIAAAVAFLLDYLDISVSDPERLESRIGLPVLSVVPLFAAPPEMHNRQSGADPPGSEPLPISGVGSG